LEYAIRRGLTSERGTMINGRLTNQFGYLCGPIDKCPEFGRGWRQDITPFLENLGINVIDPKNKPVVCDLDVAGENDTAINKRLNLLADGDYDGLSKGMKLIRNIDLRFVDRSDFLVVNYDTTIQMCGTYEEIFLANREKKPIIVMCKQGKRAISPWLFAALKHELFFDNWEDVYNYINHIHLDTEVDDLGGRWVFFNFKEIK
jgi:hypothetical protein